MDVMPSLLHTFSTQEVSSHETIAMAQSYSGSELHNACADGDLNKVEQLLSDKNFANENINTLVYDESFGAEICPLHLAVEGGHTEICELLLKNNASTSILDGEGYTPLHIACNIGNVDIVELLLKYDANPECIPRRIWVYLSPGGSVQWLPRVS